MNLDPELHSSGCLYDEDEIFYEDNDGAANPINLEDECG